MKNILSLFLVQPRNKLAKINELDEIRESFYATSSFTSREVEAMKIRKKCCL